MFRLLFIILFLPQFCNAEEKDTDKIYAFLNQAISKWSAEKSFDSLFYYIVDKPDFSFFDKYLFGTDSLYLIGQTIPSPINKTDSCAIFEVVDNYKHFRLEKSKIKDAEIISSKAARRKFKKSSSGLVRRENNGKYECLLRMSVPIFFDEGQKAIFYYGIECGGFCGWGQVGIYENIGGKWTEKIVIKRWVS